MLFGVVSLAIGEESLISNFLHHYVLECVCTAFCKSVLSTLAGEETAEDAAPLVKFAGLVLTHLLEEGTHLNALGKLYDNSWSWRGVCMSTGRVIGESSLHMGAETMMQIPESMLRVGFSQWMHSSDVSNDFLTLTSDFVVFVGIENLSPKLIQAAGLS